MDGSLFRSAELAALLDERERRKARDDFLTFYMRMTGFLPPRHIRVVCKLLQSIEEDRVDRAMVFLPPRHAKTLLCSILFPAWLIGRYPSTYLMTIAHSADYALQIGGRVRNLLRMPEWPFDHVELAGDSAAKDRWRTSAGGEMNTFGAGAGNQHGRPAEWLFMDDIIKGREMAMSATQRDTVWSNYLTDMRSRLQGRRKQMFVYTRWHMDDPAGRILPDGFDGRTGWYRDRDTGEPWFVLSMPAVSEHDNDPLKRAPGEWLWPEEFGEAELGPERKRGGWMWSALYQQRPSPEQGLMFSEEHIQRYDRSTLDLTSLTVYGASDYAVTAEAGARDPDYTVHQVWGVDQDWNIYLLDMWRGREEADRWTAEFLRLVKKWKPLRWFEESGQIIKGVGPFLKQQMRLESTYVDRVQMVSSVSKEQRAHALLGMAAMGKVYIPRRDNIPEYLLANVEAFETELLQFPSGKHDDTVDPATLFARGLDRIIRGKEPPRKRAPHEQTFGDLWSQHVRNQEAAARDDW